MAGAVLQAIAEKIDVGKIGDLESLQAQVKTMSRVEVVDFFQKIQLELPRAQSSNSYFAYVASHELSGFPAGVISLAQRAKKLKQACYFAACYADQLVLMDPFVDMLDGLNEAKINSKFISDFSFFIFMLIMMDPLIESGIVTFARGKGEVYCADCFHKLVSASDNSIPNLEIVKRVTDKLVHAAKVRLVSIDGNSRKCTALVEGPSEFFGDEPYELVFPKQGRILTNKDVGRLISPDKIRSLQLLHTHSQYSALDISTRADISENYGISRSFVSSGEIGKSVV